MSAILNDILMHYGMPKRSGRYPYGSGENPYQHSGDFLSRVEELKKAGKTQTQIAEEIGLSTTQLRVQLGLANNERRALRVATAKSLQKKGFTPTEIARQMGYKNESSIRALLNDDVANRKKQVEKTANFLREQVEKKGMIDVGVGVERELGISKEKMREALYVLELEGYKIYGGGVPQVTNKGKQTNLKVLCPPDTEHKEIYDFKNVHSIKEYTSHDGGDTFDTFVYPKSMDGKRLKIRYAEEGGIDKDGVIEIRRGVKDLSLGNSRYAQVRILVDDNKYLKGMAVYSDNMPDGVDVVFNTNKKSTVPKSEVLKPISKDPANPFGSLIKAGGQSYYYDKDGEKQLSLINKRADEGDWSDWSDKLPSQFLSKQNKKLISQQLKITKEDRKSEFDEILTLTNPTIKKHLLHSFSEDCDAAAAHLKAAALPRQKYHVILPINSLKDHEVYAPNYNNGEKVALVRYPHGGTFEIPILTVNNKNKESIKTMSKNPIDAVGINSKIAGILSGADFDGDTVMVIPTGGKVKISSTPPLKALEGFDPKLSYGGKPEGTFRKMQNTQNEMGKISNLITDMTLKGATPDELARAVKHSMVVIDAEKHDLDYKQSELDNGIESLKKKYQMRVNEDGSISTGASTIISRAKSPTSILKRKGSPTIDSKTGKLVYKSVKEEYVDKKGHVKLRTQSSKAMDDVDDAYKLVSDYKAPAEILYADYANYMKNLANTARKEILKTPKLAYNRGANKFYSSEVQSLESKLKLSEMNAPRERKAQLLANEIVEEKKKTIKDLSNKDLKKIEQQALTYTRQQVGAKRRLIEINDKEWEAIQAGAISDNKLNRILKYADADVLKERAMPKTNNLLSDVKINKIKNMKAYGYTQAEIAKAIGVSVSTINKYLNP